MKGLKGASRVGTAAVAALCAALGACSSNGSGTLKLTTGGETDTFTQAPVPVTLEVDFIDSAGNSKTLASAMLPATSIDLGSLDESDDGILTVSALDANRTAVVSGRTVPIDLSTLDGQTASIFVQRTGELARLPEPLPAVPNPVVGVLADRYVVLAGEGQTLLYDLSGLEPIVLNPAFPVSPTSMAFVGPVGWLISDTTISQYNISTGVADGVVLPSGGSLADVSGGATVLADDGSQYVVGGTRLVGSPTNAALALDSSGNPSWVTLSAERLGAAATWVNGLGLVVAGGSATGALEVVPIELASSKIVETHPYPPDPSVGSGATWLGGSLILLAGGVLPDGSSAGVRQIDVTCTASCAPTPWAPPAATLNPAQAFAILDPTTGAASAAMVVGTDATSGLARAFRVTETQATEVATKEPLVHGHAIASPIGPLGSFLVVGGAAAIESYVP